MITAVRDLGSNKNENLVDLAEGLGKSPLRRKLFLAIYKGKKPVKTVSALATALRITGMRVAQLGGELVARGFAHQIKQGGEVAYQKYPQIAHLKHKIVQLAQNSAKRKSLPTKQRPHGAGSTTIRINVGKGVTLPEHITIDHVDSFTKVKGVAAPDTKLRQTLTRTAESKVKQFLMKVIGETGTQGDWGGEKNDLFTTKLRFRGRRCAGAFALKGKATKGPLTPRKLGKNGDQIGRLVSSTATVFFVVYHSKIEESVHEQLRAYAAAKAMSGTKTYYGVIDGDDLSRLIRAYPKKFN